MWQDKLLLHLLKQKGKKLFQSQITGTWTCFLLLIHLRYLHAHFTRIKSCYSKVLREKREVSDVWWEDMIIYLWFCDILIYISLRMCWKVRWETPKSTLWIRHTWWQSVFLMQNHPWQDNNRSGCNCSVTGGSDWVCFGVFFALMEKSTCALNVFCYSKSCLRELWLLPIVCSAWTTRPFIVYKLKDFQTMLTIIVFHHPEDFK